MLFSQGYDDVEIVGIAQGMGQHDGFGLGADRFLDLAWVDVISG